MSVTERLDRYQRAHSWLGFPIGVVYKFFDDRGPYLAATVTYYGVVSLFPLMLLFVSVLGFVLQGDAALRHQLIHSAAQNFPIIGDRLQRNITGFRGSGAGVAVGVLGMLYGGTGVMQAAQAGFNQIYAVPRNEQPNPLKSRLRSFGLLLVLGGSVVLSTGVAALVATGNDISAALGTGLRAVGYLLSFAINAALFTAAFQLLTVRDLRIRNVVTGGLITAAGWQVLQVEGSRYLAHRLSRSSELYGTFGLILAAIAWIYLVALMLMLSAEINVVLHRRLWPRSLLTPFTDNVELTEPDRRAYAMYAVTQRFKGFQTITAEFSSPPRGTSSSIGRPSASRTGDADGRQPERRRSRPGRDHRLSQAAAARANATGGQRRPPVPSA